MDHNNHHFNTQNSSNYPSNNQNLNNYPDPNHFPNQRHQNPNMYQDPNQYWSNQRPQHPNNYEDPNQFSYPRPQNRNNYPDPNQFSYPRPQNLNNYQHSNQFSYPCPQNLNNFATNSNQSSFHPSMRYPSQTPPSSGHMPMVNENFPGVDAPEFPEFSTQMSFGGMTAADHTTPSQEDTTPKSKKTQSPAWNTTQNLVLISGWINCGTSSVVGKNQRGETFWRDIAEYCNEHCSFDPPRDGNACRNRWNYMNKILGKWIGAYDAAKRQQASGWSDNDVLAKAQELFACGKNVQFTLMEEWKHLRDLPRFCSQVGGNSGSASSGSKRAHDSDACDSTSIGSIPRPIGREAAKRKNKKKSKEAPLEEDKGWGWDKFDRVKEKELERLEKIASVQAETNQLMKTNLYLKLASEENLNDHKKELLKKLSQELFGN